MTIFMRKLLTLDSQKVQISDRERRYISIFNAALFGQSEDDEGSRDDTQMSDVSAFGHLYYEVCHITKIQRYTG